MDLEKHYSEAEAYSLSSKRDEARYKRAGFEHRVDRVDAALKNAKSDAEVQRLKTIRDQSVKIYKKYS